MALIDIFTGQAKFNVTIPRGYSQDKRQAIADRILQYVKDRTLEGKDLNGKKFAKYSPAYAKEKGTNQVDLFNTGAMLDGLKVLKVASNYISIGYDDKDLIPQVEGNVLGTYGQADPIPGKARNFLGITEKDLNLILSEFPLTDTEQLDGSRENALNAQLNSMSKKQRELLLEMAALGG